jgi:hypothetical protein
LVPELSMKAADDDRHAMIGRGARLANATAILGK